MASRLKGAHRPGRTPQIRDRLSQLKQLNRLNQQLNSVIEDYVLGEISQSDYDKETARICREKQQLRVTSSICKA